jgi:beta-N-acetylhexosaminidase
MELEHRVGQLLFIGLPGTQFDQDTRELVETIQPGGVVLIARNIETADQVVELTSALRSTVQVPPLIAVDQEGGPVDRLRSVFGPTPSADLLRAAKDASVAARLGEITAECLRTLGFNVNLAPVLDLALDDSIDNGLKGRYLGNLAAEVARLSGAYLEGLQRGGVVGAGKHFPGLGGATVNSHHALPTIDRSRDHILNQDLLPYGELFSKINARLNCVVVGHGHYPAYDGPAALPATLSKNIATGLLREELDFKGLTITDDMAMGAITMTRDLREAVVVAIEAGNDMVMVLAGPQQVHEAWESMVQAARDGRIGRQRISKSFDNIARVKSSISPPHSLTDLSVSRLKERIAELNLALQQPR